MILNLEKETVPSYFFRKARKYRFRPHFSQRKRAGWQSLTYGQTSKMVQSVACGLHEYGVSSGERVLLLCGNQPLWPVADFGIMTARCISVPAYTTHTVENYLHLLNDSGARVAIVETEKLARKLLDAVALMDGEVLDLLICMESFEIDVSPKVKKSITWDDLLVQGRKSPLKIKEIMSSLRPQDPACIIYTSGTSGAPLGVVLSHKALLADMQGIAPVLKEIPKGEAPYHIFLSFLPLSHAYEHLIVLMVPLLFGAQVAFGQSLDMLMSNMKEVRPTLMTAVPRLYEMMRKKILKSMETEPLKVQKAFLETCELGRKLYEVSQDITVLEKVRLKLIGKGIKRKIKNQFGGRLQAFISGGAPMDYEVGLFLTTLGVTVLQGYGQTEAGPIISVNRPQNNKLHTVGPPLEGVTLKIALDGEVLVKGNNLMTSYWGQTLKTAQTLKDGWLYTGDVGHLDVEGYLTIIDRKKAIIVNSRGENISPKRVENILCREPEISQSMTYGDEKAYLVALIVPSLSLLEQHMTQEGLDGKALHKAVRIALYRAQQGLSTIERIRNFIITIDSFSIENGMLTPSFKIRRHVIVEHYGPWLEALYDGAISKGVLATVLSIPVRALPKKPQAGKGGDTVYSGDWQTLAKAPVPSQGIIAKAKGLQNETSQDASPQDFNLEFRKKVRSHAQIQELKKERLAAMRALEEEIKKEGVEDDM